MTTIQGQVDKIKAERILGLAERLKNLMIFENEIYEEMVKLTESKDEEIDDSDSSSEEWLSLLKRLKLQEWIYGSNAQVYNDVRNTIATYGRSKQSNSISTLSCPTESFYHHDFKKRWGIETKERQGQGQRKRESKEQKL